MLLIDLWKLTVSILFCAVAFRPVTGSGFMKSFGLFLGQCRSARLGVFMGAWAFPSNAMSVLYPYLSKLKVWQDSVLYKTGFLKLSVCMARFPVLMKWKSSKNIEYFITGQRRTYLFAVRNSVWVFLNFFRMMEEKARGWKSRDTMPYNYEYHQDNIKHLTDEPRA